MKQLLAVALMIGAMAMAGPAMAQSSGDRSVEMNIMYGRGGISASGLGLPAGRAFGFSFEVPMLQGEKFALSTSIGFSHGSTKPVTTDFGTVRASQTTIGMDIIFYARPKKRFRPYGMLSQGAVSSKLSLDGSGQSRNAYGMGLYGGFKLDVGKHISVGPRVGYVFASSYGYDQNGNIQRQGIRGTNIFGVFTWRFK